MKTRLLHLVPVIVGLGLVVNVHAQTFLTNGLVAYFPFSGNANDASGNGHNGMLIGNPQLTTDRFGEVTNAYHFNGGTDSIEVSGVGANTQPVQENTVSLWMNWAGAFSNPATDPAAYVFEWGTPGAAYGLLIQNQASPRFGIASGGGDVWGVTYTPATFTNTWIQVVAVFTNGLTSGGELFINGQQQTLNMTVGGVAQSSTVQRSVGPDAIIAGWLEVANRYRFIGSIDDVRVYNRALSPTEIQQLYQVETGPRVSLVKTVKPSFSNLTLGTKYQLQTSLDSKTWANYGTPFTATNTSMAYPQSWDVSTWNELFFQVQVAP
jgi:hypothetical protein